MAEAHDLMFCLSSTIEEAHKLVNGTNSYVSCIRIKGKPILPPLMTDDKKAEMKRLKQSAMQRELQLKKLKNQRNRTFGKENKMSSSDSSVFDVPPNKQSTPARPMSLSLMPKSCTRTFIIDHDSDGLTSHTPNSTKKQKIVHSTLEQRLATEENVLKRNRRNKQKQSPIFEELSAEELLTMDSSFRSDSESDARKPDRRRWSPLKVDNLSELQVRLPSKEEELHDSSDTITPSPRLIRQDSYTVLTPSPALLSYLEKSREEQSQRSHSGRKTWDLNSARRNWDPSGNKLVKSMDEECMTDDSERSRSRLYKYMSSSMDSVVVGKEAREEDYPIHHNRFEEDMATSVSSEQSRPRSRQRGRYVPSPDVPSSAVPWNDLSTMLARLQLEHKRQKRELEERQKKELEGLLAGRLGLYQHSLTGPAGHCTPAMELDSAGDHRMCMSLVMERQSSLAEELCVRRPHSARDCYYSQYPSQNGQKYMDSMRGSTAQDTDMDVSFCEESWKTTKDPDISKQGTDSRLGDSDSVSNMSTRSSSMSSEGYSVHCKVQLHIPPGEFPKYNKAATIITAAAKGFFVRRLLRTAHVQSLITTVRDAIACATHLHTATDLSQSDVELMKRLGRQIEAAWDAVYSVFFQTNTLEKLQLIAADRERLRNISQRSMSDSRPSRISSATEKSLERKRGGGRSTTRSKPTVRRTCTKQLLGHVHTRTASSKPRVK